MAVRAALGARPHQVALLLARQGFPSLVAIGFGVASVHGPDPISRASLYGVAALDPVTMVVAAALLAFFSALASLVPARLCPATVLRSELRRPPSTPGPWELAAPGCRTTPTAMPARARRGWLLGPEMLPRPGPGR